MFKLNIKDYPTLTLRGSSQFIKKDDAIKLIKYCINQNYLIVRFEGFIVTQNYTIPIMDMIIDYGGLDTAKEAGDFTIKFLNTVVDDDLYFDIFAND